MKIISMYLPQFHQIKENDEWWGEGFTEWKTVKGAERFYEDHYQQHVPLNCNYYDLMKRETMQWQAELMEKYGVDGQCFYHYWFKDGRRILEKPAENLLRWKDINMHFCFCWANETWARSWSKLENVNTWALSYEKKGDKNDTGILLEQEYGDKEQWKKHFDYLFPFFSDNRYIKVDGKPVFVIYQSAKMLCLKEMVNKWNEWARERGIEGIYVIGANSDNRVEGGLNKILYHEPQLTMRRNAEKRSGLPFRLEYNLVWRESLAYQSARKNVIYGGFVGYDDTPRRGKAGTVLDHADPEKFKEYLTELLGKNAANGNELVFINAWNEWGEGMHLEPDERYQYRFLEAIPYAKENYRKHIAKYELSEEDINCCLENEIAFWTNKSMRYEGYWKILDAWLSIKEAGIGLEQYFINNNIHSIAIYGMGMLGKHLYKELLHSEINVEYAIDRMGELLQEDIKTYAPQDIFPDVDAIVVTATYAYKDISRQLQERGCRNVISLEEVINKMA